MPAGWGLQQTTRAPGRGKTRGQGSFGPFTGGLNLTPMGEPPTCGVTLKLHRMGSNKALVQSGLPMSNT